MPAFGHAPGCELMAGLLKLFSKGVCVYMCLIQAAFSVKSFTHVGVEDK